MLAPDQDAFQAGDCSIPSLATGLTVTVRENGKASYYRARYYDPNTGRFISEDPIGFRAGDNFYKYVGNEPTRYRDPIGLLRDCDQEHIECFRKCWGKCPPWPFGPKGKGGHYRYCQGKCLAEYMECEAENAAERTAQYCAQHPGTCVAIAIGAATVAAQPELAPILAPALF